MDGRIQELIDFTDSKIGLESYYLARYSLNRKVNLLNETIYTLDMEWFPKDAEEVEEDLNPEGTAVVELQIDNRKFHSIIFVGGKSFATRLTFSNIGKEQVIEWMELETKLKYGAQFELVEENEREYRFRECYYGVQVSPSGYIEIKFDEEMKLVFYSLYGSFPPKEQFKQETFSLCLDDIECYAKEQLKKLELPSFEKSQLVPVYAIEELFIRNDVSKTYPFELFVKYQACVELNEIIHWETPINKPFERVEIQFHEDISPEQAFSCEPHPDLESITKIEMETAISEITNFLRQVYPKDAGKWMLKTLHRENRYVHATLRQHKAENGGLQRKLLIFLDKSLKAVNYLDNEPMIEMVQDFEKPRDVNIMHGEAFAKMKPYLELEPVYVYDFDEKRFVLCGKLDSNDAVHAVSGEVISLDDI